MRTPATNAKIGNKAVKVSRIFLLVTAMATRTRLPVWALAKTPPLHKNVYESRKPPTIDNKIPRVTDSDVWLCISNLFICFSEFSYAIIKISSLSCKFQL